MKETKHHLKKKLSVHKMVLLAAVMICGGILHKYHKSNFKFGTLFWNALSGSGIKYWCKVVDTNHTRIIVLYSYLFIQLPEKFDIPKCRYI